MGISLFNAVNASVNVNKIEVIDELPKYKGDISIMSLSTLRNLCGLDMTSGYDSSTFYVYGICDSIGGTASENGSTPDNLQSIGSDWYKQLNKPTSDAQVWTVGSHKVFGGPLRSVNLKGSYYNLCWWYSSDHTDNSGRSSYWHRPSDTSVYVVVIRAVGNAAYTEQSRMEVIDKLPEHIGDVSIMSLGTFLNLCEMDPTDGYGTSTYHVYGICDSIGRTGLETGSTSENLQAIGLDWYKQLNRPTKCDQTWTQAGHKVFGGPFYYGHKVTDYYDFSWSYCTAGDVHSGAIHYWKGRVDTSVYVAVVRSQV